jgi:bifunctional DNA-binding transcriptional regulator/antitoxin component of YhaV-PrlF toxin-antitoxin module
MPQLVKGGKYVFGWSSVRKDGRIIIPEEARHEYRIEAGEKVIIMSGSRTSGGFSVAKKSQIEQSKLKDILVQNQDLAQFRTEEGQIINIGNKALCWMTIHDDGSLLVPLRTLEAYGIEPGGYLLITRGSSLGVGLAAKGPLIEEAKKHPELEVF